MKFRKSHCLFMALRSGVNRLVPLNSCFFFYYYYLQYYIQLKLVIPGKYLIRICRIYDITSVYGQLNQIKSLYEKASRSSSS